MQLATIFFFTQQPRCFQYNDYFSKSGGTSSEVGENTPACPSGNTEAGSSSTLIWAQKDLLFHDLHNRILIIGAGRAVISIHFKMY